jgi:hypothetical protein
VVSAVVGSGWENASGVGPYEAFVDMPGVDCCFTFLLKGYIRVIYVKSEIYKRSVISSR